MKEKNKDIMKKRNKENWFKRNYKISWTINFIFLLILIIFIYAFIKTYISTFTYYEITPFFEDSQIKQYSSNTFKAKIDSKSIIIGQDFNYLPSKALIEIYDNNFVLVNSYYDNNITVSNMSGLFYAKITKNVNFMENNASETRYTWLLFKLNPNSENITDFIVQYNPAIWNEQPTINW